MSPRMPTIALTPSQRKFQEVLTRTTGLNSKVVGAWILAEMGGANSSAAQKRERSRNYNWLNIGWYDSGPGSITKDKVFGDPVAAAKATAEFLKGNKFGASSGIQKILNYAGQSPEAQINAIASSGWASSGYNGGSSLRSLFSQVAPITPGRGAGLSTGGGSSASPARVPRPSVSSVRSVPVSQTATATIQGVSPVTGGNGLADLLSGLQAAKRPQMPVSSVPIQAPATSSDRYLTGVQGVQPSGVSALGSGSSGVAEQLASLVGEGADLPVAAQTATATASGSVKLPKVTAPTAPTSLGAAASPVTGGSGKRSAADAVKWAQSTVGVAETTGPNRGPRVDEWQKIFGMQGQYWCAMWTSLAATKGGMPKSGRTVAVRDVRKAAQTGTDAYQRGFVDPRKAKPGDLILFGNDHIGMVEKNTGKSIVMIAGNDANRVNRRTIAYGNGDIVRPKYGRR